MNLMDALLSRNQITQEQAKKARSRQQLVGGLDGENLRALGFIGREQLHALVEEAPAAPRSIEDTGLAPRFLLDLILKFLHIYNLETIHEVADAVRLSVKIVEELLGDLKKQALIQIPGSRGRLVLRHSLTSEGKQRASEALAHSAYVGPAPVPLGVFCDQVEKQSVTHEQINADALEEALSHLVLPRELRRQLGSALNSGRAILLYGGPGNGKSSVARSLGSVFQHQIHVPYALIVDDQVIKLFDPAIHHASEIEAVPHSGDRLAKSDPRWVRCRRPLVQSGGELTLGMLDLEFDSVSKYYEAPLQLKAMGGLFVIDDFGRQMVRPEELLNRWLVPLEKKMDYLTLHTGKKFQLLFDEIVVFSSNIPPTELLDEAMMRRVDYKLEVDYPTLEAYETIFRRICRVNSLEPFEGFMSCLEEFYSRTDITPAAFHPRSLIDDVLATCRFEGSESELTLDRLERALTRLEVKPKPLPLSKIGSTRPSMDSTPLGPPASEPPRNEVH